MVDYKIRPEYVHKTHKMVDDGYLISDPHCEKCGASVYEGEKKATMRLKLLQPCKGQTSGG